MSNLIHLKFLLKLPIINSFGQSVDPHKVSIVELNSQISLIG